MKALVKRHSKPGLWLEDVPEPGVGINDVLIRIHKTGICGTDLHIFKWDDWARKTIPVPMTVGHEFVGEIVRVGSNVVDFQPGQIVSGEGHVVCGRCRNCLAGRRHLCADTQGIGVNRPGAFAEYLSLPMSNVWVHHGDVDRDVAAIFDPFGNAVHTALSFPVLGEDVLITGAGPIGIIAAGICRHIGARHVMITDVNDYRLELAREMGADQVVNVTRESIDERVKKLGLEGFDIGLEMSGHPVAFNDMLKHMYHGGKVALLGLLPNDTPANWDQVIFKGLELHGIYGRRMYETWYKMTQMVLTGFPLHKVLTHHIPIDDFEEGFGLMASGQCGKVVCDWTGEIAA
jgi:threonine 3-dehydrogenase